MLSIMDSPLSGSVPLTQVALHLNPIDDVAIAKVVLSMGLVLERDGAPSVQVKQFIPLGHKIALRDIGVGEPVRRYGQIIGFATQPIPMGGHVHTQNIAVEDFTRDYGIGQQVEPVEYVPEAERRTFMGYQRADGRVGTRNYIAIISSVNCSAHTIREIAHHFTPERLAAYPNVDGVIALAHTSGCGQRTGGADLTILQRTMASMANHPNVGAYLMVGLGCETNQIADVVDNYHLHSADNATMPPPSLTIQESGGIRKTVQRGIEAVERLLPFVNQTPRTPQPISELVVGLKCGGSDSWSGITANPVVGLLADEIVRNGGTAALAETPEIYGAEHLLTRRAISAEVAEKLIDKVHWWERHAAKHEMEIDNNPSAGNKVGGLTTILEKSLGAVAKGGSTPLMGVFDYAEPITVRGFTFVDTPGYDPVCVTGQVASGCNIVLFTTGRGSVFGYKPAPSIKIATNTAMYEHMLDDMDFNTGTVLEGVDMRKVAADLLDLVIGVASGKPSKSEEQGVGEAEFIPWNLGGTL
ncbi:MAG: altronate dehydratase [Anaerolineae bacterium]|nr:altronate dehydratase [Anaerolineae bacterium]